MVGVREADRLVAAGFSDTRITRTRGDQPAEGGRATIAGLNPYLGRCPAP